ncbi:MAG: hypothetical protein HKN72_14375 [Gemmatimonadetes bacterium]|nr:HEAT repeat domain-containing protein [Gemmatimonadota bacterium]NNF14410.1 hypothetical protein [Gemmatimonadota bacterium]NNL30087.1 hypothetical protein [Gemmatimonadota bacterium]
MVDATTPLQATDVAARFLSPGEALLLLILLTGAVFLAFSVVMATWTLSFRARKLAVGRRVQDRTARWQFELREVLYGDGSLDALRASIDDGNRVEFLNFLLEYARRLDGEEHEVVRSLAEPHLAKILPYLDHRVAGRRARAVQTLGELGLPGYAEQVISALDDPSPDVAMVAASTLAAAEDGTYADAVLARMERFAHWRLDFLVAMLSSMGAAAAPAFRWTLADDQAVPRVRAVAADALAQLDDAASADLAHEVLTTQAEVELRAATLRLLASVGRGEHVDAIRLAVEDHALPTRLHAVRALGSLGSEDDLDTLYAAATDDPSPWVAIAAARALKEAGGADRLELLAGSDHSRAALGLQVISEVRSW